MGQRRLSTSSIGKWVQGSGVRLGHGAVQVSGSSIGKWGRGWGSWGGGMR